MRFSQSVPFDGNVVLEPSQVRFKGTLARGLPKKRVPVNVRFLGELDPDYEIRSVITDPSEIQIEGKTEDLAKVDAVDAELIDISLLNSDQVILVPLRHPEVEGEARAERKLTNIPVELRGTSDNQNYTCNPSGVTVTVEGRPSLIETFDPDKAGMKVYADMSNIFMTPVTLPVRTEIASGDLFRITGIEPQNVTVNSAGIN